MRGEDTILGTALARAIESQPLRSTPYERSRVAVRMAGGARSPLFPVLAAAAAVVLGLALGAALLGQRGTDPGGVASSPTPSPDATGSPTGTAPTAAPSVSAPVQWWVYFARDQLPPVGVNVVGPGVPDEGPETMINGRLSALWGARANEAPAGTVNVFAQAGRSGSRGTLGLSLQIAGDLATVTFDLGDAGWNVSGSAASQALLQQLVYTITEEPGIRRAMIKDKGKETATIDQLVVDKPLTREDVLPYEGVRTEERIALEDDPRASTASTRIEDIVGGIRFIIELKANEAPAEGFWSPRMTAAMQPADPDRYRNALDNAKWVLEVAVEGAQISDPTEISDAARSPLRSLVISGEADARVAIFQLGLDDARPWRISLEPGSAGTMRLIVDIGGHPQAISESVAVYGPEPGDQVARTFTLTGTARAFEAHVAWRIKDSGDREVATGFVTASLGTSPVWGTFTTEVKIPDNVSGVVTLEVFWPSPRDGADVGTVAIPLRVR